MDCHLEKKINADKSNEIYLIDIQVFKASNGNTIKWLKINRKYASLLELRKQSWSIYSE